MASEKTTYWMAFALLAFFVGNHFAAKYSGSCLADRTMAVVQRLTAEATHVLATAQMMLAGTPRFVGPEVAVARVQSQVASVEAVMARQQASCARIEAQRARMMALQQMQHIRVICPRQNVTVEIPQAPVLHGDGTI